MKLCDSVVRVEDNRSTTASKMATHQWTLDCVSYQLALQRQQRLQYYVSTKERRKKEAVIGKKRHERCEERQKERI
jgi:hypothetical protein